MSTKYIVKENISVQGYHANKRTTRLPEYQLNKGDEVLFYRNNKKLPDHIEVVTEEDDNNILIVPKSKVTLLIKRKYFPIKDELYDSLMSVKITSEPSFIRCLKHNITEKFINSYKMIVSEGFGHRQNNIIFMSGKTGTGKSISSISLCKIIYPKDKFSYKNIFFFDQEILEKVHSFPPNSVVIRDENPSKGTYGTGSRRIETQVDVIADTCRKHGLSLIFIEPEFRKSDIAKFYLETIDYGAVMDCDSDGKPITDEHGNFQNVVRTNRIGVKEPKSMQFIGGILIPIIDESDQDWIAYNEVKDDFIDNMKSGDYAGSKIDYIKIAKDFVADPDNETMRRPNDIKLKLTLSYSNLTTSEINMLVTAIQLTRKGIDISKKPEQQEGQQEGGDVTDDDNNANQPPN